MEIAVISSLKDKASTNIKEALLNKLGLKPLGQKYDENEIYEYLSGKNLVRIYAVNSELIHTEDIDKNINADLFLFVSKHRAKEDRKSLTIHPIGNFGKAQIGGRDNNLCPCPAAYFKSLFNELVKNADGSGYEVTVEATHHGPYLEKPVLFIEIGPSEKEWEDKKAAEIVAQAVINSINSVDSLSVSETAFVIGGTHYNHVANKLMPKSIAVGHICSKHNLERLDAALIKEAMQKTVPAADFVLLDWKGLGKEKQRIISILEEGKITYKKSNNLNV